MTGSIAGGLMICGTSSDAGKSTVVTGLCRALSRRGLRVAPFKAQNMALNSMVTVDGAEIGRAQAAQAEAAGVEPEAAMNPILLKPSSNRSSQVMVMGKVWATLDARAYQEAKKKLWPVVTSQLAGLRERYDAVICEGAGSPAEINLLEHDLVNLRLAHHARLPALLVGDIDRGGVFASMFGTVALLPGDLARCIRGFVINKFRGDQSVLAPGLDDLERRTGIPTLGVLPWMDQIEIDAEDSLALRRLTRIPERHREEPVTDISVLDVAVVALPRISNFTDIDALALEADVRVRLVDRPGTLGRPDLIVLPGTKSTLSDLDWLRRSGLGRAIADLVNGNDPLPVVLGICGGYQMLGEKIEDSVESPTPRVEDGLGLLPVSTVFESEKFTSRQRGTALEHPISGYEIHHGRTSSSRPWIDLQADPTTRVQEGSSSDDGRILGTSLHGLLESDGFRQAFLADIARRAGATRSPSGLSFSAARQARYDRIADCIEEHLDLAAVDRLIKEAAARR
jgi:adenosylcobyric acid synthase